MNTKYFIDKDGNYLGAFSGVEKVGEVIYPKFPENGIEVSSPPQNAKQKWNGKKWLEYIPPYDELRKAEYPPIEDYIDGIVKGDDAQVQAYIDACQAVKEKYPKP